MLHVVRFNRGEPKYACLSPGCGAQFFEGEEAAYQAHVPRCVRGHHDEVVAMSAERRLPGFYESVDPELRDWMRRTGRYK